jgi:hypothetical protein
MNKVELLCGALAWMMFLSGCAPVTETNKPQEVTAIAATSEFTPTMEATATNEAAQNAESKAEVVNNINKFLASDGEYSDAALADKIFIYGPDIVSAEKGLINNDLGTLSVDGESARVQGINLGAVEGDNCVWLFWGTKMGSDNKREVVPVKIPLEDIKYRMPISVSFLNSRIMFSDSGDQAEPLEDRSILMTTEEDVYKEINTLVGRPILMDLYYHYTGDPSALRNIVTKNGGTENDFNTVQEFYLKMFQVHTDSFCSFHPVMEDLTGWHQDCGSGYKGVMIDSKVQAFSEDWLQSDRFLSITILTTYIDNGK